MNERIKAIGRQAGLVFIEDGVYGQRWYSSRCGLDAAEYEKLVEFIVAECAGVCEQYRGTEWGKAAECVGDSIREHFGVE